MEITRILARSFILLHHGLFPPRDLHGKDGILSYIDRVGCIQFDPINIVGRNPDLVLQSRISNYKPSCLDELLYHQRELMDGYDKQAAIYRTSDWPFFHRFRMAQKNRGRDRRPPTDAIENVLEEMHNHGPLSSLHFKHSEKMDWHWGPTKISRAVLEFLYSTGRIGIDHRIFNRRVFDLIENLLPDELHNQPDPFESIQDYHDWHTLRRIGSLGIADSKSGEYWLGILRYKSPDRNKSLDRLAKTNRIIKIHIEELPNRDFYLRKQDFQTLENIKTRSFSPNEAAIIAPLDNLIWNRALIKELFNFEYVWEVYKPKKERKYGYYVLPVLYQDQFIARFEPGFDKKSKAFSIINWWWEKDIAPDRIMVDALIRCFNSFVTYLDAKSVTFSENIKKDKSLSWLNRIF